MSPCRTDYITDPIIGPLAISAHNIVRQIALRRLALLYSPAFGPSFDPHVFDSRCAFTFWLFHI